MRKSTKELLRRYLYSAAPILYIHHSDFAAVDNVLEEIMRETKSEFIEFNNALGVLDFKTKAPKQRWSLAEFLHNLMDDGIDAKQMQVFLLKDVHEQLRDPQVIALLRRIAERALGDDDYRAKVVIVASEVAIPRELESFVTLMDVPLPDDEEIKELVNAFAKKKLVNEFAKKKLVNESAKEEDIPLDKATVEGLVFSLKGLNALQIRQVLSLARQDGYGDLKASNQKFILGEKEQAVRKSGILEMMNFKETIDDIGGLEKLKEWLKRKAKVFASLERAIKFGVDVPNGILILGMPGCGKSLAAKATATLFNVPLIRLDVGRLMGMYVGESEGNMRRALALAETVSPCVLWIDELEKAFAGVGSGGGEVTTRLFGHFLTWMQEKESTVFIVATANDISKLPPEFLRKGRFDELFFVDLPNAAECRKIIEVHLEKRDKWDGKIDAGALAREAEKRGFSGADLEAVVKDAVETAFIDGGGAVSAERLKKSLEDAKSISDIQGEKIKKLRDELKKYSFKPASETAS